MQRTTRFDVQTLIKMAMVVALSLVFALFIRFPIFPVIAFMEYDPGDIPLMFGSFLFGPIPGVCVAAVAAVLRGFLTPSSGVIGVIMHFAAIGSYVIVAGFIYKARKTLKSCVIAMLAGIVVTVCVMVLCNIFITPSFMGVPQQAVLDLMLPAILPFNVIKFGVNSTLAFVLYRTVGQLLLRKRSSSAA